MKRFDAFRPDGLDMSRPPTREEAHAITVYLSAEQGYYTGIQTPLTSAEALWLQTYMRYCLLECIDITQIQVEGESPDSVRIYALSLSYLHPELGPLSMSIASLADESFLGSGRRRELTLLLTGSLLWYAVSWVLA